MKSIEILEQTKGNRNLLAESYLKFEKAFMDNINQILSSYIDFPIEFKKYHNEIVGRFRIKGEPYYFETQNILNYPVISFKIYDADHYVPAYGETKNKVHFINYNKYFEKNLKKELKL